ncbi:hypothetical protein ACFXBB_36345 [Streptomyces scopuliridis]|uniref:hypothetical protein n=1 Tax=Streptomyces scopuliridis TaxID=452529 RepID=UPI0036C92886
MGTANATSASAASICHSIICGFLSVVVRHGDVSGVGVGFSAVQRGVVEGSAVVVDADLALTSLLEMM